MFAGTSGPGFRPRNLKHKLAHRGFQPEPGPGPITLWLFLTWPDAAHGNPGVRHTALICGTSSSYAAHRSEIRHACTARFRTSRISGTSVRHSAYSAVRKFMLVWSPVHKLPATSLLVIVEEMCKFSKFGRHWIYIDLPVSSSTTVSGGVFNFQTVLSATSQATVGYLCLAISAFPVISDHCGSLMPPVDEFSRVMRPIWRPCGIFNTLLRRGWLHSIIVEGEAQAGPLISLSLGVSGSHPKGTRKLLDKRDKQTRTRAGDPPSLPLFQRQALWKKAYFEPPKNFQAAQNPSGRRLTANVSTEGANENFPIWDIFEEFPISRDRRKWVKILYIR
ncbi:hypothetical protein B0H11DRAFT_1898419 [Mycena galericulata]|nr:hypothetical protein B0H11DRAFT_1898419 [Mycena galericulata]